MEKTEIVQVAVQTLIIVVIVFCLFEIIYNKQYKGSKNPRLSKPITDINMNITGSVSDDLPLEYLHIEAPSKIVGNIKNLTVVPTGTTVEPPYAPAKLTGSIDMNITGSVSDDLPLKYLYTEAPSKMVGNIKNLTAVPTGTTVEPPYAPAKLADSIDNL